MVLLSSSLFDPVFLYPKISEEVIGVGDTNVVGKGTLDGIGVIVGLGFFVGVGVCVETTVGTAVGAYRCWCCRRCNFGQKMIFKNLYPYC